MLKNMRLIDADALYETLCHVWDRSDGEEFERAVFKVIANAPTADRPTGEWIYLHGSIGSYMTISCPFCGETFNDVAEWKYNFCPNCGADMRGE